MYNGKVTLLLGFLSSDRSGLEFKRSISPNLRLPLDLRHSIFKTDIYSANSRKYSIFHCCKSYFSALHYWTRLKFLNFVSWGSLYNQPKYLYQHVCRLPVKSVARPTNICARFVSIWLDRTSAISIGEERMEVQIHHFPASSTPGFAITGLSNPMEPSAPKKSLYIRLNKSLFCSPKTEKTLFLSSDRSSSKLLETAFRCPVRSRPLSPYENSRCISKLAGQRANEEYSLTKT